MRKKASRFGERPFDFCLGGKSSTSGFVYAKLGPAGFYTLSFLSMESIYYSRCESPIGPLLLGVSDVGLVLLAFDRGAPLPDRGPFGNVEWVESPGKTSLYCRELEEYFAGLRKQFTFALDLRGTEFQKQCWTALLTIPFGETRSYADIARQIGRPKALRAVGSANHDNPIAVVVPCHRVVGSSGRLTGYGGGLEVKRKLLELEGAWTSSLAL